MTPTWLPQGDDYERVPELYRYRRDKGGAEFARERRGIFCRYAVVPPNPRLGRRFPNGQVVLDVSAFVPPVSPFGVTTSGMMTAWIMGSDDVAVANAKAALDEMETMLVRLRGMQHEIWGGLPKRAVGR